MVAIVHNSGSLRNALHYNENKVAKGVADCIHSINFPKDTEQLTLRDKLNRLQNLALLNQRTKINSVHISLNFDSSDLLDTEKITSIAEVYMQRIGFGEQPYLVYQHHDAGHPHIHIVTTNIKSDGKRIMLHNLGSNLSMKVSKELEKEFGLTEALSRSRETYKPKPIDVYKVQYGKRETKRAITNVLDAVLPHYKYASLAELNAVLKEYNVLADRGSENSRIYQSGGLVYRILNERGEKIGIPIKASIIYNKPILQTVQAKFLRNKEERQPHKQRVKTTIDFAFAKTKDLNVLSLHQNLKREGIQLHLRQNEEGIIYGLTFVDHRTKCVFNGSELGKQYSANGIQQRIQMSGVENSSSLKKEIQIIQENESQTGNTASHLSLLKLLNNLTEPDTQSTSPELLEEEKRKRKKRLNN